MDQSCSPVTFEHVKEMSEAYTKVGTVEAITRRLNILFTWFIAGRAAEGAWTVWSGSTWSSRHGKLFVEVVLYFDIPAFRAEPSALHHCRARCSGPNTDRGSLVHLLLVG